MVLGQGIGDEAGFFEGLVDDYEEFVFTFFPIITRRELLEAVRDMKASQETRAFVHATAAITINMRVNQRRHCDYDIVRSQVLFLVTRGLEIRGAIMPYQRPNVQTIMLSTFIHVCLFAHHVNDDMAFFYLREAITNLQILDVDGVAGAANNNNDRPRLQRLYWLLFIHERFASLRFYRVPILSPLSSLPVSDGTLEPGIEQWYTAIIQRFCMLDDTFIANWIKKGNPSAPECDAGTDWSWIEAKQAQLSAEMDLHAHPSPILTEMQQVDIIITSYWVRTLLWQIALSVCLLTSDSSSDWMSLSFPLRLSHQLQSLLTLISRDSIEVHGAGILQKIFDITSTIADILIHVTPLTPRADTEAHIADFFFLYDYLNNMSKFFEAERKLLQEKRERIRVIFSR
ncbi:hypothetical protein H2204_012404 [Knufia peltigerae]|uniref:Transcription factor domain-containing protein n=1 Tax=Knufia peltigerae TaxID=1002370 RepID=A0AA38XSJ0_9EURO|nr:hypothetical protein H2204_012404 [Knufia peltigerae]